MTSDVDAVRGVQVRTLSPVTAETVLWRLAGVPRLTVVIKSTFSIRHDDYMEMTAPAPLIARDIHHDATSLSSLSLASEVAPHLPDAGVIVTGHAYAPPGQPVPALTARFAVVGGDAQISKSVHIYGDRTPDRPREPTPFQRMDLRYERAVANAELNPVGITARTGHLPNLVDPATASKPGGFGPICRYWPIRRRLRTSTPRNALEGTVVDVPAGFDWSYFHSAPLDQRLRYLHGDEWVVLDRLHPTLARVQSRLPLARGHARVTPGRGEDSAEIGMVCDTMVIDCDRQLCHLLWRGRYGPVREEALDEVTVDVAVTCGDVNVIWPEVHDDPASSGQVTALYGPDSAEAPTMYATDAPQVERLASVPPPPPNMALPSQVPPSRPSSFEPLPGDNATLEIPGPPRSPRIDKD